MSSSMLDQTVLPPVQSVNSLAEFLDRLGVEPTVALSGPDGEQLVLPPEVFGLLRDVVDMMAQGHGVAVAPVHERLTTQEAAGLLGVSRPTLVKLLESGEIEFERPGCHRRIRLADLLAYRERISQDRRVALDRMAEIANEAGMYDKTAEPRRTR